MVPLAARSDAVVLPGPRGLPVVQRVGVLDRLTARLRAGALDRALAAGAAQRDAATALHARRLCSRSMRERLAGSLSTVIAGGAYGRRARATIPVARSRVRCAQDELMRLVNELLQPGPVDPAGVARVRLLLSDGAGPLYNPHCDDDLTAAAEAAIYALML